MFARGFAILFLAFIVVSCQKDNLLSPSEEGSELSQQIDDFIFNQIEIEKTIFDWNNQSDELLCKALLLANNILVVGYEFNLDAKKQIEQFAQQNSSKIELVDHNEKLGIYFAKVEDCNHISSIRNIQGVVYVELDYLPADVSRYIPEENENNLQHLQRANNSNPGEFIVGSEPYLDYLQNIDGGTSRRARLENMEKVYDELHQFGSSEMGIAVIDNGVFAEKMPYFSVGPNGYQAEGFYKWKWWNPNAIDDGIHPLPNDFMSIWQHTPGYSHGTGMSDNVYSLAPFAHRRTIRASPTYILLTISQLKSVTEAISAMADDDQIRIISMSMAGPFKINQMASAIRYFDSKNKLFICAAGSSLPILKDILGILFPARMPETVSVTGIENLAETGGEYTLGVYAHGGYQNDFIVEDSESSSTATSTFAGMMAVIWAINPNLDRNILRQYMVDNSEFYQLLGNKHTKFGWGKVDMYELALDVQD